MNQSLQMTKITAKRQSFAQQIRRRHRGQIKQRLREFALLNCNIITMLDNLSSNFCQLVQLILHQQVKHEMNPAQIFELILAHRQSIISNKDISHHKQIAFFIFLLQQFPALALSVFEHFFLHLIDHQDTDGLSLAFVPLKMMVKKDEDVICKYGRMLLDKVKANSFTLAQLTFYRHCLLNLQSRNILHDLVRRQIVCKISQHLSYSYYTPKQKTTMMEVLTLALHKIKDINIGDSTQTKKLYKTLKLHIFSDPSSLQKQSRFIQASLNLTYELIITQQNTIFLHSQLFAAIQNEICNQNICIAFKRTMAKNYIVAILHLLLFTKNRQVQHNTGIFLENIRYLVDIFTEDRQVMTLMIDLLRALAVQFQSSAQTEPILDLIERTEHASSVGSTAFDIPALYVKQI